MYWYKLLQDLNEKNKDSLEKVTLEITETGLIVMYKNNNYYNSFANLDLLARFMAFGNEHPSVYISNLSILKKKKWTYKLGNQRNSFYKNINTVKIKKVKGNELETLLSRAILLGKPMHIKTPGVYKLEYDNTIEIITELDLDLFSFFIQSKLGLYDFDYTMITLYTENLSRATLKSIENSLYENDLKFGTYIKTLAIEKQKIRNDTPIQLKVYYIED